MTDRPPDPRTLPADRRRGWRCSGCGALYGPDDAARRDDADRGACPICGCRAMSPVLMPPVGQIRRTPTDDQEASS